MVDKHIKLVVEYDIEELNDDEYENEKRMSKSMGLLQKLKNKEILTNKKKCTIITTK